MIPLPDDFFAAQRRERVRSRVLITAIFGLLWLVANAALFWTHRSESCEDVWPCQRHWEVNGRTAVLTALGVGGYLAAAHWRAKHWAVTGPGLRTADGPEHAQLRNVVDEIAIAAGIATPSCYIMEDPSLNAFAVSDGRRGGAIVCTTGLLAKLDRRELAGVVAHEIAHIRNRDSSVILVAVMSVGLLVTLAAVAWAAAQSTQDPPPDDEESAGEGAAVAFGIAAVILWVIAVPIAVLLHAGLSRRREWLADAAAVQYTRDPTGLRRALERLAASPYPTTAVNAANQALWIDCPGRTNRHRTFAGWLDTHPPIHQRIAWLRTLEGASTGR